MKRILQIFGGGFFFELVRSLIVVSRRLRNWNPNNCLLFALLLPVARQFSYLFFLPAQRFPPISQICNFATILLLSEFEMYFSNFGNWAFTLSFFFSVYVFCLFFIFRSLELVIWFHFFFYSFNVWPANKLAKELTVCLIHLWKTNCQTDRQQPIGLLNHPNQRIKEVQTIMKFFQ